VDGGGEEERYHRSPWREKWNTPSDDLPVERKKALNSNASLACQKGRGKKRAALQTKRGRVGGGNIRPLGQKKTKVCHVFDQRGKKSSRVSGAYKFRVAGGGGTAGPEVSKERKRRGKRHS